VEAELEFKNPLLVAVTLHEVDGVLTLGELEMSYEIKGLEPDMLLARQSSHTVWIELEPNTEQTLALAREGLDGGIDVHFDGWARVSVWGQEQTLEFQFDKVISVYGMVSPF